MKPSPCLGICQIDTATGYCLGCARSADEIAVWRDADPHRMQEIWARLPPRRARLGIRLAKLAWTDQDILRFIETTLRMRSGTWVFGVPGAIAEFSIAPGERAIVRRRGSAISALTPRGALRTTIGEGVRAMTIEAGNAILLAVPRVRLALPVADRCTALGADRRAVAPERRADPLFDLGLGRSAMRFLIRSTDAEVTETLTSAIGYAWPELLARAGGAIVRRSPHRIIETAIGRAEIFTAIPVPGGVSPVGPHTHLIPALLENGRETPDGVELPRAYAPAAIYYPAEESEG